MKRIILSAIAFAALTLSTFAQSPESMKYQAVVRDASQNVLPNQAVGMQLTILQGSASGTIVYQETFADTTNAYGLVNIAIGTGTVVSGNISTIDWSAGPYFIETAVDAAGGTSYVVMGTSQLLSVPYALYSKTAGSVANDMVNDADSVIGNEYNTTVVLNGTNLETTDGGGTITTDLSSLQDGVNDADSVIGNEYNTTVVLNGTNLETTDGGGTITTDLSSLMVGADTLWQKTGNDIANLNTGNVGIGTTTPSAKLHVIGGANTSANQSTWIAATTIDNATGSTQLPIELNVAGTTRATLRADVFGNLALAATGTGGIFLGGGSGSVNFSNNSFYDGATGNLGIGTTAPVSKLQIANNAAIGALDNFSEYQLLLFQNANAVNSYGLAVRGSTLIYNSDFFHDFDVQGVTALRIDANGIVEEAWQNATLQNGWTNFGSTYATPQYYKDKEGVIHVKGAIKGGTGALGTVLFTLPAGYTPNNIRVFLAASDDAGQGTSIRVDVQTNGDVVLVTPIASTTSLLSLEFSFRP